MLLRSALSTVGRPASGRGPATAIITAFLGVGCGASCDGSHEQVRGGSIAAVRACGWTTLVRSDLQPGTRSHPRALLTLHPADAPQLQPRAFHTHACGYAPEKRFRVGVLGATGAVGQRFLQHLEGHPWFEVTKLGASERSAGKEYKDATAWHLSADAPAYLKGMRVVTCEPQAFGADVDLVFSALVRARRGGRWRWAVAEAIAAGALVSAGSARDGGRRRQRHSSLVGSS